MLIGLRFNLFVLERVIRHEKTSDNKQLGHAQIGPDTNTKHVLN